MTTHATGAPPQAPIVTGQGGDGGGDPVGRVRVTRNVPPKRVQVLPGNVVTYAGKTYSGDDPDNSSFLIGEGASADGLALNGHVIITSHDEAEAWNGSEGDEVTSRAHALVDDHHARYGGERTHDHGFRPYEHADGADAIPVDVTDHRQQVAQRHAIQGLREVTNEDIVGRKGRKQ